MPPVNRLNSSHEAEVLEQSNFDPIDRGRLACWFTYAIAFWGPVFAAIYGWVLGSHPGSLALCIATAFALLTPSVLKRSGSAVVAGNYLTFVFFSILLFLTVITGGHASPPLYWNIAIPIVVAMLANLRSAILWTVVVVIQYTAFFLLDRGGYRFPHGLSPDGLRFLEVTGTTGLTLLVLSLACLFEHYRRLMKHGLESSNRAKSEFLANMSHELRTPMTAILGYAESLSEPDLPQSKREDAIRTICRNGGHLLEMVNDILDISKVEANQLIIQERRFSVAELVWEIQDLMQVRADEKRIVFEVEFTSSIPETIQTDPTRLRQILINLIGNAIKFTDKGSVRVIVHYLDDSFHPLLRFDVIDTGIGIATDLVDHLFRPFAQADGSVARRFGGTGLGLAISKRLAEMLNGRISVHSDLDHGSQFGLTLATCREDVRLIRPRRPEKTVDSVPVRADTKPLVDRRFLLAEDGIDNQRLITHILEKAGADVKVVKNGQLAVEAVAQADSIGAVFDVILMDVQMPVLDGHSATRRLRDAGYVRPIVAVTAHAMDNERIKCLAAGCNDVLTKPINRAAMIDTLVNIISETTNDDAIADHATQSM